MVALQLKCLCKWLNRTSLTLVERTAGHFVRFFVNRYITLLTFNPPSFALGALSFFLRFQHSLQVLRAPVGTLRIMRILEWLGNMKV